MHCCNCRKKIVYTFYFSTFRTCTFLLLLEYSELNRHVCFYHDIFFAHAFKLLPPLLCTRKQVLLPVGLCRMDCGSSLSLRVCMCVCASVEPTLWVVGTFGQVGIVPHVVHFDPTSPDVSGHGVGHPPGLGKEKKTKRNQRLSHCFAKVRASGSHGEFFCASRRVPLARRQSTSAFPSLWHFAKNVKYLHRSCATDTRVFEGRG